MITPAPGYQVDPSNPNGVIPIQGGGQTVGATPVAQAPASPAPLLPTPAAPTPTIAPQTPAPQQASQGNTLAMPANGSVVDLLNMAGQDSSFAARQQLAQQYGVQNYSGTAAQNTDLAKKYLDAYNAKKGAQVPQNASDARTALSNYFDQTQNTPTQQNPTQQFMDVFGGMNPVESQIYTQLSGLLSSTQNQQSLTDLYAQESAAQGLPALNLQLADLEKVMDGTEDDIRAEITKAGGTGTESQVQALTAARNKTLLTKANYLQNVINSKNDYIQHIVDLTQADRAQVSKDLDQKLGITNTILSMSQNMENAARQNYNNLVNQVGYDGLVESISSPQELSRVAQTLGMSPQTLLQLSTVQTSAQKQMALQEMNYQLSVDKFNEDKKEFGLQYALTQQKASTQVAAQNIISPYQLQLSQRSLQTVDELLPKVSSLTVGAGSLLANFPGSQARDFAAQLDTLKTNIIAGELTAMREASKTGGALGNVSDTEGARLSAALGALDSGQSVDSFKTQLNKVKESIYSWNAQALSLSKDFDYQGAVKQGYSNQEIFEFLSK